METNRLYYPPPTQDLQYAFDCNVETKQRFNMDRQLDLAVKEGTMQPAATGSSREYYNATCAIQYTEKKLCLVGASL